MCLIQSLNNTKNLKFSVVIFDRGKIFWTVGKFFDSADKKFSEFSDGSEYCQNIFQTCQKICQTCQHICQYLTAVCQSSTVVLLSQITQNRAILITTLRCKFDIKSHKRPVAVKGYSWGWL